MNRYKSDKKNNASDKSYFDHNSIRLTTIPRPTAAVSEINKANQNGKKPWADAASAATMQLAKHKPTIVFKSRLQNLTSFAATNARPP
ncbi:MAG: hypothetical protein GY943_30355 [Chloroflexi bacterium]|nr:hypothetical protein [Chloroflexota bacterium]